MRRSAQWFGFSSHWCVSGPPLWISTYHSFSSSHTTWIMPDTSTAHTLLWLFPKLLSDHSFSISSCALVRRKHNSHRGVDLLSVASPAGSVLCFRLKEDFGDKADSWRTAPMFPSDPPHISLRALEDCKSPPSLSSPCPIPARLPCSQLASHHPSQWLLAATRERCQWLMHNYGGQKNVDVLAKSILWKPLSSQIL